MSAVATATPFRYSPIAYLGVDADDGEHRFMTDMGVVAVTPDCLDYILSHPKIGPLHAEAMERAKA